ncbi:MAG: Asp-tRNA(Asn)/Glu-tRNA(Gln) amidotransferase subunit GatC [Verrucomicrobiota bacterium]|nr:Asp-tRNA(Asn)/Glu-tRNA(Gln) amidotransferase subunit GatC [Verrucomicrobiota bacterium]
MSSFDKPMLTHLKKLCRIDCSAEEEELLLTRLQRVLGYVGHLSEIPTERVEPCCFVLGSLTKKELREDIVGEVIPRDTFLEEAPEQIASLVRVPPVLKAPS